MTRVVKMCADLENGTGNGANNGKFPLRMYKL